MTPVTKQKLFRFLVKILFIGLLPVVLPVYAESNWNHVLPILERVCFECHDDLIQEGEIDLSKYSNEKEAMKDHKIWEKVEFLVKHNEMPPAKEKTQPTTEEKNLLIQWIDKALDRVAKADAGSPGIVTMRRLTNVEYDNTIHHLTSLKLNLGKSFARDSGGGEGFTNTGDVLFVSPEQLEKYLSAARKVAERASILPGSGIVFNHEPVGLRGPSWVGPVLNRRLQEWYYPRLGPMLPEGVKDMRIEDYLYACWQHQKTQMDLSGIAKKEQLDPVFLTNWWKFLKPDGGDPIVKSIRQFWHQILNFDNEKTVKFKISSMANNIRDWMNEAKYDGSEERQDSESSFYLGVTDMGDGNNGDVVIWSKLEVTIGKDSRRPLLDYVEEQISLRLQSNQVKAIRELQKLRKVKALFKNLPTHEKSQNETEFSVLAPSVTEIWLPPEVRVLKASARLDEHHPKSKLASVQVTVLSGKPPKLPELIPSLRFKFNKQSSVSANFHRAKKNMTRRLRKSRESLLEETNLHLLRSKPPAGIYYLNWKQFSERLPLHERDLPQKIQTDMHFFYLLSRKALNSQRATDWNNRLLNYLSNFAEQAFRRPLNELQKSALSEVYHSTYIKSNNREDAAREALVRILVSPSFLFKTEPTTIANKESSLDAWALASRLSYFLWSTSPDSTLHQLALDKSLLQPKVLKQQLLRMLKSPKANALSHQFASQWLGIHEFLEDTQLDPELFPEFNKELRHSMHSELMHYFSDLVTNDRSLNELIHGKHTFLNARLAKHYGITSFKSSNPDQFVRWQVAEPRGGLLGMGVLLSSTSFPNRTSPVRRGDWVITTLLGHETPPVPADVPELENDGLVGKLPLRERLEKHRESKNCMVCHVRIDPPGFALENFDPLGRWRLKDAEGHPINASADLYNGDNFVGPSGLKGYLKSHRSEFLQQFCRKLLGYALGREIIITDRPLLEKMKRELHQSNYRFSSIIHSIVNSRQFLNHLH